MRRRLSACGSDLSQLYFLRLILKVAPSPHVQFIDLSIDRSSKKMLNSRDAQPSVRHANDFNQNYFFLM